MQEQLKLFVVAHKKTENVPAGRTLIGVGADGANIGADCSDGTGDNISSKNASYCELTALYWIWKNTKEEYVGFEHYRRFFFTRGQLFARPMRRESMLKVLASGKIIVPKPHKCPSTVAADYAENHSASDLELCRDIISSRCPQYLGAFDAVMNSSSYSLANMFVMPMPLMNDYCGWLFPILFEAEKHIDICAKDSYQRRVFGFLAERLFNVWLAYKKVDVCYAPVYNVGDCPILVRIKGKLSQLRRK